MRVPLALPIVLTAIVSLTACGGEVPNKEADTPADATDPSGDAILAKAYEEHATDLQVEGRGIVVRVLDDDVDGSRHQRFVVRLGSGQTVLVAHNIDLAPRVRGLRVRSSISFYGEYEWNEEGGTIHWTHIDPDGEHVAGWLRHGGRTYQ